MSETYLYRDEKLTKHIKMIFGDIVKDVAIQIDWFGEYDSYKTKNEKERYCAKSIRVEGNTLTTDSLSIVIEFTNGNKVLFYNSEWGGFENVS